jgi:agmatine deiminase
LKGHELFRSVSAFLLLCLIAAGSTRAEDSIRMMLDQFGGMGAQRSDAKPYPRLSAEFEKTRLLLFSMADWQPHHRQILIQLAQKTAGHVNVMVLCNDTWQIKAATGWLLEAGTEYPHVYFCEMKLDTVWLRDFGPIFAQTERGADVIDFFYEGSRPKDDGLPLVWSQRTGARHNKVPWTMQGGNLLPNGQGLALTTHRIFDDNHIRFPEPHYIQNVEHERRSMVVKALMEHCNLQQLAVLEPLQSELTKHVDMFATFLSANDVLVAQLDPQQDAVNAGILERNVSRLTRMEVGGQPLRVHRIPIPARQENAWSAYTNAILANDLVLMPTFESDPPQFVATARATYQKLMPHCTIETIDMTSMKQLQGELHCMSLHVPEFAPLPDRVYPFANAQKAYFPDSP